MQMSRCDGIRTRIKREKKRSIKDQSLWMGRCTCCLENTWGQGCLLMWSWEKPWIIEVHHSQHPRTWGIIFEWNTHCSNGPRGQWFVQSVSNVVTSKSGFCATLVGSRIGAPQKSSGGLESRRNPKSHWYSVWIDLGLNLPFVATTEMTRRNKEMIHLMGSSQEGPHKVQDFCSNTSILKGVWHLWSG